MCGAASRIERLEGRLLFANSAPTVSLANTATDTTAPADVTLMATVKDKDGDKISKVEFYRGSTKLSTDKSAPYRLAISNLKAGTYKYTAKAYDSKGKSGTSSTLTVVVINGTPTPTPTPTPNQPPTVSLANTSADPSVVDLLATATDVDGRVVKVEFFNAQNAKVGEDASAPFKLTLDQLAPGDYTFTARATDDDGAATTSALLQVTVGAPTGLAPVVTLRNPASGTYAAPGYWGLRADASDPDGTIDHVDFVANGQTIATATAEPYLVAWKEVAPGTYSVTAVAYDNDGRRGTSSAATLTIAAPSGGKTYYVSPSGKLSNSGSQSSPVNSISQALSLASPGDTVLVLPGTYFEQITVPRSGTSAKPIVIKAQTPGTVIVDGADKKTGVPSKSYLLAPLSDTVGDFVWLSGITFRRANNLNGSTNAAIRTQDGWRVEDVVVEDVVGDGVAILGANVMLRDVTAQDNGATGISGTRMDDSLLLDSVMRRNNQAHYKSAGAGGKMTRAEALLVDNVDVYDNEGPGFWFDIDNIDCVVRNSAFHDNNAVFNPDGTERITGRGLFLEISGVKGNTGVLEGIGPILLENNLAYDNDAAGITIYATAYVTARGNTLVNNMFELKDKRPTPYSINHLTMTGNSFKNAPIFADRFSISDPVGRVYKIDGNTYDNAGGPLLLWSTTIYTSLSSIQSDLGFEQHGVLGSVSFTPRNDPA